MSMYIVIGASIAVGLLGTGVAMWSIYRTHRRISERNRRLTARVDAALSRGSQL